MVSNVSVLNTGTKTGISGFWFKSDPEIFLFFEFFGRNVIIKKAFLTSIINLSYFITGKFILLKVVTPIFQVFPNKPNISSICDVFK